MQTLLLDQVRWDIITDANGNIALASEPYSTAQDVASACRLFFGELWYDTQKGILYFQKVLGTTPPTEFLKAQLTQAALTVPGVVEVVVVFLSFVDGELVGQVQFANEAGKLDTISFDIPTSSETVAPFRTHDRLGIDFVLGKSFLG